MQTLHEQELTGFELPSVKQTVASEQTPSRAKTVIPVTTDKRIVSKGEYTARKTLAVGLSGAGLFCGMSIVLILLGAPCLIHEDDLDRSVCLAHGWDCANSMTFPEFAAIACSCLLLAGLCFWWATRKSWKTVDAIQPFTRANTADLPAPDTLVRASSEPLQTQKGVLLRAAQRQETPPEQLVRASTGHE